MVEVEANELVIVFEPITDEDGVINFLPIEVVEGHYDEDCDRFIDTYLYSYPHLTKCERSKGYAYRDTISNLMVKYPDKSLNEIKEILIEEHSGYNYFLGIYNDAVFIIKNDGAAGKNVFILDQDTKENIIYLYEDEELSEMMLEELEKKGYNIEGENVDLVEEKDEKITVNPHLLYKQIKETVKGQDQAIKEIVTAIWENTNSDHSNNIILVGASGTGKTEILRQLSQKLDIPLLITSVTGMSQAGYVGTGTDEILKNLLTLTKGDVEKAEHAIVVLDEIDKVAFMGAESGKISTDGVQNELLKIVEDGTFYIDIDDDGYKTRKKIETGNITFIGVGAFNGMLVERTEKKMGFGNDITSREIPKEKVLPEDLIKYGLKPELVGRMGKIIKLNDLDLITMKDIIKNSKKSAYTTKTKFINSKGVTISPELEEEIIEEIAKIAISKKIGARSIAGIVNEMFSDILFDISDPEEKYTELEITKETVTNPKKYTLRK